MLDNILRTITSGLLFIGLLVSVAANAANINIVAVESGGNVFVTGSGSIDLTGLTYLGFGSQTGQVRPAFGGINVGPSVEEILLVYQGGAGTTPFGTGSITKRADTGTGDMFGMSSGNLLVADGYAGGPLVGSSTYNGANFASLGMTEGSYLYTFSNDQTLSLQVGPVPLPAAAWLFGSALFGLLAVKRRKA